MTQLLNPESSFEELKKFNLPNYLILPINTNLDNFKQKINKLKFPLWLKLNSSEHKLQLGGVKKVESYEELKKEYKALQKKFEGKTFIIQEDIKGIEIIMGIKTDKTFGKILLLGTGGSLAETINDTEFRALPLEKDEIISLIDSLKISHLLKQKSANISSLTNLILSISKMNIEEADFNPIIVNEKDAWIIDSRMRMSED